MNKRFTWILGIFVLAFMIGLFAFGSAYSADKPTVATVGAQADDSKGILKGLIKESGGREISQYGFKWGVNRSLGKSKAFSSNNPKMTEFSMTINSLKAGNTYYYQAFAVNAKGVSNGEIKSFTVPVQYNAEPVVILSSPVDNLNITRGEIVKIAATASDDQKVESMALYINDASKLKSKLNSIKYDWDTGQVEVGKYMIMARAWDGSQAASQLVTLNVIAPKSAVPLDNQPTLAVPASNINNSNNNSVSRGDSGDKNKYPLLSKVNGIYGQFRYRDIGGGRIEVDPQWVAQNIVTITLPGLNQAVEVHKAAVDNFILAFTYIKNGTATINGRQVSLLSLIDTMDGTYVTRHVMWDPTRSLSNHSWGTAIDINADAHFRYVDPGNEANDPNLILWEKAFKPAGFSWGNSYSDSMHYELK